MTVEKRVGKLEINVATLNERVGTHITKTAEDKVEAKKENVSRHSEVMAGIDTLGKGIDANSIKLSNMDAVADALDKLNGNAPMMSRKQRIGALTGGSVVGGGGIAWIAWEIFNEVFRSGGP